MNLASFAMDVRATRGRRHPELSHPYRNDYARDRDRVIHSRAFRRLEAKTQVFTTRFSDHFRDRLTHTLEVAQIARTVAAALHLNSDLAEALALVHDIGHPPFGHAGERILDELMHEHGDRFDHNLHALRIVEQFERRYLDFPGLNLTFEVREGIIKHSRELFAAEFPELAEYLPGQFPPVEAQLIDRVDEIAYNSADLDDAFEARLLHLDQLFAEVPEFGGIFREIERDHAAARTQLKFNESIRRILDSLVTDVIDTTGRVARETGVSTVEDVRRAPRRVAAFSSDAAALIASLKRFLVQRVYSDPSIIADRQVSVVALQSLFRYYLTEPGRMPAYFAEQARQLPAHRVVCDYIAGMTDQFLIRQHSLLLAGSTSQLS